MNLSSIDHSPNTGDGDTVATDQDSLQNGMSTTPRRKNAVITRIRQLVENRHTGWVVLGSVMLALALVLAIDVVLPVFFGTSFTQQQQQQSAHASHLNVHSMLRRLQPIILVDLNASGPTFDDPNAALRDDSSQCIVDPTNGMLLTGVEDAPLYPEVSAISPAWATERIGKRDDGFGNVRTFDVQSYHTALTDVNTTQQKGVVFNVETTPEPLPEDLNMTRLSANDIWDALKQEAGKFYSDPTLPFHADEANTDIEVQSKVPLNMIFAGGQGFVAACMMAFANHLPLALTPNDIWTVIASGFAYHVDQYAEELRYNFVNHTGKLQIEIREDFMLQSLSPPEQWEALIFPKFSQGIQSNMNNTQVYDILANTHFTTSTPTSQAASEITLMAAMKSYYQFTMTTSCGIPKIQLDGTRQDWELLRNRTAQLAPWMMQNNTHGDLWIKDIVLPILDQFLLAYDGTPTYCFWQNMVKFRSNSMMSGGFDFLSGWLPNLFPYLTTGDGKIRENRNLRHWTSSALGDMIGPNPSDLPVQLSSAPVLWNYYGLEYPMHFHAGFRGVAQVDDGSGMLRPVLGWYVTYDPSEQ